MLHILQELWKQKSFQTDSKENLIKYYQKRGNLVDVNSSLQTIPSSQLLFQSQQ